MRSLESAPNRRFALRRLGSKTLILSTTGLIGTAGWGWAVFTGKYEHTGVSVHRMVKQMTSSQPQRDSWIVDMHSFSNKKSPKSQGSQDDYLSKIFEKIGKTNRFFVEFGFNEPNYTGGGSGANTWNLYDTGWRGLLLDGRSENAEINLHAHYLFQNNIADILNKYKVTSQLDYLSCDMDSHDLFVFKAILEAGFKPRVITTEYNSNFPLGLSITQIDPTLYSEETKDYNFEFKQCAWGASASALRSVASQFGYVLIGRIGWLDLVWLRADLIQPDWVIPDFEWFFHGAGLGQLHHQPQSTDDVYNYIMDYASFKVDGNIQKAKDSARKLMEKANLPCFRTVLRSQSQT